MSTGPNPALAGILGAIPFGVGAVYNGQYAKGLAHLVIFCLLNFGANTAHDPLDGIFGVGIAFFVLYQIFDAVRTARAIQMGEPVPDPFGLGRTFGAGEKIDTSKVPTAAIILIALGALFLLQTSGFLDFSIDKFWPLLLIALGFWMMARRLGLVAGGRYRAGRTVRASFYGLARGVDDDWLAVFAGESSRSALGPYLAGADPGHRTGQVSRSQNCFAVSFAASRCRN